jgi:hypothetical protein
MVQDSGCSFIRRALRPRFSGGIINMDYHIVVICALFAVPLFLIIPFILFGSFEAVTLAVVVSGLFVGTAVLTVGERIVYEMRKNK